jgi:hypothetical protein
MNKNTKTTTVRLPVGLHREIKQAALDSGESFNTLIVNCLENNIPKGDAMKDQFRIQDIQKATVNGRKVKIFKAFEYDKSSNAYIYCGQFEAPQETANKDLWEHIPRNAQKRLRRGDNQRAPAEDPLD